MNSQRIFSLYPNPVDNLLNLDSSAFPAGSKYTIKDVLGKTVLQGTIKSEIFVSNLKSGLYLLSVYDNKKSTTSAFL